MDYRELLDYVKRNPGCIQTAKQQEKDSQIKYRQWVERHNRHAESRRDTKESSAYNNH
jgi:hypothetical protein